jgi:hypothetical protein
MKKRLILTLCLFFTMFVASCEEMDTAQKGLDEHTVNAKLINTYNNMAIENAILAQHTLYPYHFIQNSEELNDLGFRDFGILAGHFLENPGTLNVRQDLSVSDELYERRIENVNEMLVEAGVDTDRIEIEDGMPGGSGAVSERAILINQRGMQTGTRSGSTSSTTMSSGIQSSGVKY